jgi:hypothetical protein
MMLKAGVRTGKQQVPPLRYPFGYASVGMTILLRPKRVEPQTALEAEASNLQQNCHPDRSVPEGVAQRRDLLFAGSYADRVELCES